MNYARLLEGKVAVITSGGHGMGKCIAKVFARHGAICAINGMNPKGELTAEWLRVDSPGSFFTQCDMSVPSEVHSFTGAVLERAGGADIVVNNVGINRSQHSTNVDDADFDYTQQVNLFGAMRLARGFLPSMTARGGGAFVHISTIHSRVAIPDNTAYASSKSALNGFSVALAAEYARYGIRSNVICPGGIYTRNTDVKLAEIIDDDEKLLYKAYRGERGQPDYGAGSAYDIAHSALFLASEMARSVTGAVILSDGGTVLQSHPFAERRIPPKPMSDKLWLEVMRTRY
jgi:NAD(P)-dependent dehydrogenase (short-subunit alcohol dehydrogenase family)